MRAKFTYRSGVLWLYATLALGAGAVAQDRVYLELEPITEALRLGSGDLPPGRDAALPPGQRYEVNGRTVVLADAEGRSLAEWRRRPGVRAAYRDFAVAPRGGAAAALRRPDDPGFAEQWNFDIIDVASAWDVTTGGTSALGRDVVIAAVESNGFTLGHPELVGRYFTNPTEVAGNGVDDDGNGLVDDFTGWNFATNSPDFTDSYHGTHVAATLVAATDNGRQTAGLNWGGRLLPLEVSTVGEWTIALDYLADLRERYNATDGREGAYVVVANMSLGADGVSCEEFPPFANALDRLGRAGVLSVAAVGNSAGDADRAPDFPTSCPSEYLVTVTATDREDRLVGSSGYGPAQVDIAAPGARYPSVDYELFGQNENYFEGTSGAAPHVAGVAALAYAIPDARFDALVDEDPAAAALLVREALLAGVDLREGLTARVGSGGRLNAGATLSYLLEVLAADGSVVVLFADGVRAPERLSSGGDSLEYARALGRRLNAHLYLGDVQFGGQLTDPGAQPIPLGGGALAAARNVGFALAAEPSQAGLVDAANAVARLRLGGDQTGANGGPSVVALFADGFGGGEGASEDAAVQEIVREASVRAPREIAGNGVDDDGNGAVDDVSGRGFAAEAAGGSPTPPPSAGGRGGLLAAAVATAGGELRSGLVLPLSGETLAQWVAAADYALEFRERYNDGDPSGLPVTTLAAPVDANALYDGASLVAAVAERLLDAGIVTVLPHALLGGAGDQVALGSSSRLTRAVPPGQPALLPQTRIGLDASAVVGGAGVAVALAAAGVDALYRVNCPALPSELETRPRQTAERIASALAESRARPAGPDEAADPTQAPFDVAQAAMRIREWCPSGPVDVAGIKVFPNPSNLSSTVRVELNGLRDGEVDLVVYGIDGRPVAERQVRSQSGVAVFDLRAGILAAGVYTLVGTAENGAIVTARLVRTAVPTM